MSYPVRKTWKTLHLASPLMHGVDGEVKEAQQLLTNNRFKNFKPGAIDGTYGEHSANATHRAKFWLGYPKSGITGAFGPNVRRYLLPETHPQFLPLTTIMRARRLKRIAAAKLAAKRAGNITNIRDKAFAYSKSQIGYHESPTGSNMNKAGAWYGANGVPWCAIWQTYCWVYHAGYSRGISFARARRWSYVPYIVADARSARNGLRSVSHLYVVRGDLVCYDWEHNGTADHVEAFDQWISHGVSFYAVGGNTGPSSKSNGGEVAREIRYVSEVAAFVKVVA